MGIQILSKNNTITTVPCYRSLNLLAHAQLEEIDIGSRCGGHGICGGDRIQIITEGGQESIDRAQLSAPTEIEKDHLSEAELQAGWRLACQTWPSEDDLEFRIWTSREA